MHCIQNLCRLLNEGNRGPDWRILFAFTDVNLSRHAELLADSLNVLRNSQHAGRNVMVWKVCNRLVDRQAARINCYAATWRNAEIVCNLSPSRLGIDKTGKVAKHAAV